MTVLRTRAPWTSDWVKNMTLGWFHMLFWDLDCCFNDLWLEKLPSLWNSSRPWSLLTRNLQNRLVLDGIVVRTDDCSWIPARIYFQSHSVSLTIASFSVTTSCFVSRKQLFAMMEWLNHWYNDKYISKPHSNMKSSIFQTFAIVN